MTRHADRLRQIFGQGPCSASQIGAALGVSQQAVSRAVVALGDEVLRIGAACPSGSSEEGAEEEKVWCYLRLV